MSNVVEFVLRMRDMMSSSLATAAQNAKRHLDSVSQSANNIPNSLNRNASSFGRAGSSLGGIFKGNFLASATMGLVSSLGSVLQGAGSSIVGGLFDKHKSIAGLETFLGTQGASELYKQIQEDAAATPFGTEGLLEVNKALVSAGLGAKEARADTLALANAISAVGGGNAELSRMAANMQQIKTVGVATAMDIKQFAMTGINIYQILADATGKSIDQVKELDVSYELLSDALRRASAEGGVYFGAMDRYSKTLPGMWGAFKEGLASTATKIGSKIEPAIGSIMQVIVSMTDKIPSILSKMQPVFDFINNSVASVIDGIGSVINGTSSWSDYVNIASDSLGYVWDIAKGVGANIWDIVSGVVQFVKHSELLKGVFYVIQVMVKGTWTVVGLIVDKMKWMWDNVVKPMWNMIENVYRLLGNSTTTIQQDVELSNQAQAAKERERALIAAEDALVAGFMNKDAVRGGVSSGSMSSKGISSKGVTQSGPKVITVNISKMIEKLEINSVNIKEGIGEMENLVREYVMRAIYSLETSN
jgi:tape measure domain-containing protein